MRGQCDLTLEWIKMRGHCDLTLKLMKMRGQCDIILLCIIQWTTLNHGWWKHCIG